MTIDELKAKVAECEANLYSARKELCKANIELEKAEFGYDVGAIIKSGKDVLVYTKVRNTEYDTAEIVGHAIKKDGTLHASERRIFRWYTKPESLGMYDKPIPPEYL